MLQCTPSTTIIKKKLRPRIGKRKKKRKKKRPIMANQMFS
jgi:hypothetical protein